MKKEKPFILVVLCMFLLLLLIVVPPVFRKYIPKENVKLNNNMKSIEILRCDNADINNTYIGSSISKYINNKIVTNTIKFIKNNTSINNNDAMEIEYQLLINMENANVVTNDNITTIVIDSSVVDANQDNEELSNYFSPIENQKSFYEYMGYSCQIIKG